jgi:uncharacterized Zn finger protein (UPF0148 family)
LTKGKINIDSKCKYCSYPLRRGSEICPNCNKKLNENINSSKINQLPEINIITSKSENLISIKFIDEHNNEREINNLIKIKKNPKTIKLKEINKKVMVLRPLKVEDTLKNGDILIIENKIINKIKIKSKKS